MDTSRAVVVTQNGDRSVLEVQEREVKAPAAGQVQVEVLAAGINFIDVYKRQGVYPQKTPFVQGQEGAGRVLAVGHGVERFDVGEVVAWCQAQGSQATVANLDASQLVDVPDEVDPVDAAAVLLQGITAHYLSVSTFPIKEGHTALVHAAAGGVGQLLVQMITARGGRVVATAGSEEKLAIARSLGAVAGVNYSTSDDLAEELIAASGGGFDVVYDGVGKATFDVSLDVLHPRGTMVLFGGASGQVPPFDLQRLNSSGSLYITRPSIVHYIADLKEFEWRAREVFDLVAGGVVKVDIGGSYSFDDAAEAYEALESRGSRGKLVLVP